MENVDRLQRFCNLCTGNMLGDEFHYLLECTYFTEKRKKYLPKFYLRHVDILKFQKLMSTENLNLLKQLSRFISIVLSKSPMTERAPYRIVYKYVIS